MTEQPHIAVPKFLTRGPEAPAPRVEVTAVWLAEQAAKQRAYDERRRRYTDSYREPGNPADTWSEVLGPVSLNPGAPAPRPAQRGHIHDRKQRTFAL